MSYQDQNDGRSNQTLFTVIIGLLVLVILVLAGILIMMVLRGGGQAVAIAPPTATVAATEPPAPAPSPVVIVTVVEIVVTTTPSPTPAIPPSPTETPAPVTLVPSRTPSPPPASATATITATAAPTATLAPTLTRAATPTLTPTPVASPASPITRTLAAAALATPGATATLTATATQPALPLAGHIVFTEMNGNEPDIMAVDAGTGSVSKVHTWGRQPRLRADGRVLFNGTGGGKNNLITVLIGGNAELITSTHPQDAYPDWSPSGESSVFYSTFGPGELEKIYIQNNMIRAEDPVPLQWKGADILGRTPTWLKNWRIAYSGCDYWLNGSRCGIWTLASDGTASPVRLSEHPEDRTTDSAGGQVLYASPTSGNWDVYVVPDSGGPARNLTNSPSQDFGAAFSPDGKQIAFASDRDGGWGIWIMNADGTQPRKLIAVPGGFGQEWQDERLSWGP